MKKKICVVTGSRAEYGLLRRLLKRVEASPELELQVIATGTHLSPEFGLTYREIEGDGIKIHRRVEMLLSSDTGVGASKSLGLGIAGMADALDALKPDILMLLGDRFEILAAACAALMARIPVAHIHGGELTEGAVDDAIRHAITKCSHLHFVAAADFRRRVIQLGEDPGRVFLVGGLGVEAMKEIRLLSRTAIEQDLGFRFGPRNLLVTFHPPTLEPGQAERQMRELLAALETLTDTHIIFTMPNADPEGRALARLVDDFVGTHPDTAKAHASLGQLRYFSCLSLVDGVVGNSSSALLEAPSFRKGVINIGSRQRGRLRADNVIDCDPSSAAIAAALARLYSPDFQRSLADTTNPYERTGTIDAIVDVLERCHPRDLLNKTFHDVSIPQEVGQS